MTFKNARYSAQDVTIESEEPLYSGFFKLSKLTLRHRLFKGGMSASIERELFAKAEACCAMVYDPKHDLIGFVEQFRAGTMGSEYGPWTLEGVAGMVEPGEAPKDVIVRELMEEAGLKADHLIPITQFYPTPGSCDEYTHLYCALCDLSEAGGQYGLAHEGEDILFSVHNATQVLDAMLQSRMNNAATLVGLMWLQLNRSKIQEDYGKHGNATST